MNLLDELQEHVACGDGATGTLLLDRRERRPTRDQRHQNECKLYDMKPGRATICLPLLPEDQNVLNAMLAKTVGVWMRPSTVVENMLVQLTASRGTNEDRL